MAPDVDSGDHADGNCRRAAGNRLQPRSGGEQRHASATVASNDAVVATNLAGASSEAVPTTAPAGDVRYVAGDGSQVMVTGTSTLHDWTVKGGMVQGDVLFAGQATPAAPASLTALDGVQLTIPVNSLKSSEGGGMDDTMYKRWTSSTIPPSLTS